MSNTTKDDLRDLEEAIMHLQAANEIAMSVLRRNRNIIYELHEATKDMFYANNELKDALYLLEKEGDE